MYSLIKIKVNRRNMNYIKHECEKLLLYIDYERILQPGN